MTPPSGGGAVDRAPDLPLGFAATFESLRVEVDGVGLHAVVGGTGPALLLLGGWPQNWYQWRLVMPELARHHTLVVVDPRGTGLSDKPPSGYDSGTQATDVVGLMEVLGHRRFDMVGHDVGMWTAYAVVVDHPERVARLVVSEANVPTTGHSPPLLGPRELSDFLWHIPFNRTSDVGEQLVRGREKLFFAHQFATKAGAPTAIPSRVVDYYVELLTDPPALRSSFEYYRALDVILEQNETRTLQRIDIPVLTLAGERACGELVGDQMRQLANDVSSVVVAGCGHYLPEEAPSAFLRAVSEFFARTGI